MKTSKLAQACLLLLLIGAPLLTSCNESEPTPPRAVVKSLASDVLSETTREGRKAAIKRALAPMCARPLTDDELNWVSDVVEESKSKGVDWLAGRLLMMHRETKACRGQ